MSESVTITMNFAEFTKRLDAFAERYCRVKPSLGMIGELFWVVGFDDFEFKLVPRDRDAAQRKAEGFEAEGQQPGSRSDIAPQPLDSSDQPS